MKNWGIFFITFFIFLVFLSFGLLAEEKKESFLPSSIFTTPYFKVDSETEILGPLFLKNPLVFLGNDNFKAEINIAKLNENRIYTLPDASGEICLSSGNCLLSPQGTTNRLAKFGTQGLINSSIEDFYSGVALSIDENGNILAKGKIQSENDICTNLEGGICLSQTKTNSLKEATIEGAGTPEKIPIWKKDYQLGDSNILQSDGNIGIGIEPAYKLDVAGTVRMLGFRLPVSPKEGYGLLSDDQGFGTWRPVLTPQSAGMDVAENFLVNPNCKQKGECPEAGDLVSFNESGFIEKSAVPYDRKLIGVVSTNPTLTLGKEISEKEHRAVALIGRVPVKVSLVGGPIEIGDFLTSSFLPGIAQKAVKTGRIVGVALESLNEKDFQNCQNKKVLDCEKKIGKIEMLINLTQISNP